MDYKEIQSGLRERGFSFKQGDGVNIKTGEDIYSSTPEDAKSRHGQYCQNIVSVPAGSYLTDVIGDDYKNWKPGDDIWLNSTCGTGKTTFVMNIIEYFLDQGYKILYLTNRTQLLNQVKLSVLKKLNHPDKNTPVEYLHLIKNIDGYIYFSNYQGLAEAYKNKCKYRGEVFANHKVLLVCDEVHWFTSDCLFSEGPDYVLDKLLQQFFSSITLYMTSTDWDTYSDIGYRLSRIHQERYIGDRLISFQMNPGGFVYNSILNEEHPYSPVFSRCYTSEQFDSTNIKAYSFNSDDNIIEQIRSTSDSKKWLIFADTKEHGEKLQGMIPDSVFIFSEDWNYKLRREGKEEMSNLVTDEMFKHRVLIATSILDCGTTISDKDVKHVVVNSIDPVTTMQFVGRVRRNGSSLNLYFNARSDADIWRRFTELDDKIKLVKEVTDNNNGKALSENMDDVAKFIISRWIYITDNRKFIRNNLGFKKACSLRDYIAGILADSCEHGKNMFLVHQLNLFGLNSDDCYDLNVDKEQRSVSKIVAVIDPISNKELTTEDYKAFCSVLDSKIVEAYGSTIIRGTGTHKPETYNTIFKEHKIPYEVLKDDGKKDAAHYTFRKVINNAANEGDSAPVKDMIKSES